MVVGDFTVVWKVRFGGVQRSEVDRVVGDHKEAKVTQTTCRQSLQKSVPDCTTRGVHVSLIFRHLVLARCTSFIGR